jgi:hypothetical protein
MLLPPSSFPGTTGPICPSSRDWAEGVELAQPGPVQADTNKARETNITRMAVCHPAGGVGGLPCYSEAAFRKPRPRAAHPNARSLAGWLGHRFRGLRQAGMFAISPSY